MHYIHGKWMGFSDLVLPYLICLMHLCVCFHRLSATQYDEPLGPRAITVWQIVYELHGCHHPWSHTDLIQLIDTEQNRHWLVLHFRMLHHIRDAICVVMGSQGHTMTLMAASIGTALLYGLTSTSMAFINKIVLGVYSFNFPLTIMTAQMAVTFSICK